MRKIKWTMLALVTLALLSLGFSACSSDDDSGDGTGVVGVWDASGEWDGSSDYKKVVATFKSNGTGTLDAVFTETYRETESFTYVKDNDTSGTMNVKQYDDSDGGASQGWSISILKYSITGDTMILTKVPSGHYIGTLTRRK